jgi:hypothetical protein
MTLLQWMTRRGALVINVTLLHDEKPQGLLLAPVMKQKIGKEILIFGSSGVQHTMLSGVQHANWIPHKTVAFGMISPRYPSL